MRRTPALAHIPVILLTGAFDPVDHARARDAGCAGVLVKPFDPQMLIARVRQLLEARRPVAVAREEHLRPDEAGRNRTASPARDRPRTPQPPPCRCRSRRSASRRGRRLLRSPRPRVRDLQHPATARRPTTVTAAAPACRRCPSGCRHGSRTRPTQRRPTGAAPSVTDGDHRRTCGQHIARRRPWPSDHVQRPRRRRRWRMPSRRCSRSSRVSRCRRRRVDGRRLPAPDAAGADRRARVTRGDRRSAWFASSRPGSCRDVAERLVREETARLHV